jgi:hypothetical protein
MSVPRALVESCNDETLITLRVIPRSLVMTKHITLRVIPRSLVMTKHITLQVIPRSHTSRAVSTPRVRYIRACVYFCLLSIRCFNVVQPETRFHF